jgi:hypothetical protein
MCSCHLAGATFAYTISAHPLSAVVAAFQSTMPNAEPEDNYLILSGELEAGIICMAA